MDASEEALFTSKMPGSSLALPSRLGARDPVVALVIGSFRDLLR